ncbi:MAG: cation/multidrug efflux pump [Prosthecobacter sp.]|nr:cation/multidrug efflux pump [Prosthecobacter sp.]
MWIVQLALRRPYTFVVAAFLLLLATPFVLLRTPTDIFPAINIPVVSLVWQYTGLSAREIEQRMVGTTERGITTSVNNIEHIESTSYDGVGVIKIYFQPGTAADAGVAEVSAAAQSVMKQLPPGTTPPLVIQYNASTVPILQYAVSSKTLNEQQIQDLAMNQIRVGLVSVAGAGVPLPFGGKVRLVSVDLDMRALEAKNLSAQDVVTAMASQSLILPSGTAKIGTKQYPVDLNTNPPLIESLNDLPIKTIDGAVIRVSDVAHVRDGNDPQQNIVRQDGVRSTLISVLKTGSASTLAVAQNVKAAMVRTMKTLQGQDVTLREFADQSLFVTAAVAGVVREGVIAGALTALMILLFLGSWRSTIIIAISIPLSVLASLAMLSALGETINLMTLGGLALAVGILVDDATVAIENIHRHLHEGKEVNKAIMEGSEEIASTAFVSTICICIVFVPMFFLDGVARYLFVPLAEAVVFAVLASYLLSRTLVPTLVMWMERHHGKHGAGAGAATLWMRPFIAFQRAFERGFSLIQESYRNLLGALLEHRLAFATVFLSFCVVSLGLIPYLGRDFFPAVDSGSFRLHMRAQTGSRIEETASLVDRVESSIRKEIPPDELVGVLDNIGLPVSGINLSYNDSGITGPADADIMVSLKPPHRPTAEYVSSLRKRLLREYPGTLFYFLPSDIVAETVNFGLPAPFDIQIAGKNLETNRRVAAMLAERIRHVRGVVDVRVQQPGDLQRLAFDIDRTKASQLGLSEKDIANSLLLGLSGSVQVQPTYWLDSNAGIQYLVNIRAPEYVMDSLAALQAVPVSAGQQAIPGSAALQPMPVSTGLQAMPVSAGLQAAPVSAGLPGTESGQLLANVASVRRTFSAPVYSHYNVKPVIDIFGGVSGRDLAGVLDDLKPILAQAEKEIPATSFLMLRGQVETMQSSFVGLSVGLVMAVVLIFLLLVVNFQSLLDPFIIVFALAGALAGVAWGLHLTTTTLSVPAMMGAIMCLGVATANSVLVVTFARHNLNSGHDCIHAAWEAGSARLRPVMMTALAMIIGMVPMALGFGDGGEQNAPLGRAVIGGLFLATVSSLFFVPVIFSLFHRHSANLIPEATPSPDLIPARA